MTPKDCLALPWTVHGRAMRGRTRMASHRDTEAQRSERQR